MCNIGVAFCACERMVRKAEQHIDASGDGVLLTRSAELFAGVVALAVKLCDLRRSLACYPTLYTLEEIVAGVTNMAVISLGSPPGQGSFDLSYSKLVVTSI